MVSPRHLRRAFQGIHGMVNAPALVFFFSCSLYPDKREHRNCGERNTILKVSIVLIFYQAIGWKFIQLANYVPYMIPEGVAGHVKDFFLTGWEVFLEGAGIVFRHWFRCCFNSRAQEAKTEARYADRNSWSACHLHFFCTSFLHTFSPVSRFSTGACGFR